MKEIFVFGLGHLSKFLVKELGEDFDISGTYRSKKLEDSVYNVKTQIHYESGSDFDFDKINKSYDFVVWSLPPVNDYTKVLEGFNSFFTASTPWLFVSSTSVYKSGRVTEESVRDGDVFRRANLNEIENTLQLYKRPITVVRPSGLVDEQRNPVNFFKNTNRELALKGEMTNLVHTKDVAGFIKHVISNSICNEDFNLASLKTYEKSKFYRSLFEAQGLKPPVFIDSDQKDNPKVVDSSKSRATGFSYEFDDLLNYFI